MRRERMEDCLFCKLINGNDNKVFENELFYIIKDISPQAPLHYLAIPKTHFKYLKDMSFLEAQNLGKIFARIAEIAETTLGLFGGYRLVINQGDNAGQTVPHLHIHILGGKEMGWNPA